MRGMLHDLPYVLFVAHVHDTTRSQFFLHEHIEEHLDWPEVLFVRNGRDKSRRIVRDGRVLARTDLVSITRQSMRMLTWIVVQSVGTPWPPSHPFSSTATLIFSLVSEWFNLSSVASGPPPVAQEGRRAPSVVHPGK